MRHLFNSFCNQCKNITHVTDADSTPDINIKVFLPKRLIFTLEITKKAYVPGNDMF